MSELYQYDLFMIWYLPLLIFDAERLKRRAPPKTRNVKNLTSRIEEVEASISSALKIEDETRSDLDSDALTPAPRKKSHAVCIYHTGVVRNKVHMPSSEPDPSLKIPNNSLRCLHAADAMSLEKAASRTNNISGLFKTTLHYFNTGNTTALASLVSVLLAAPAIRASSSSTCQETNTNTSPP